MSVIAFNADGTMVATRDDVAPTTVWLWDLTKLAACAVLIQHSPVKQMSWHPSIPSVLLIQCTHEEPTVYVFDSASAIPYAVQLSLQNSSRRLDARWLKTASDKKPALIFSDTGSFLVAWPDGKDVILRFEDGPEDSDDSLYEILTGRSPAKMLDNTEILVSEVQDDTTEVMDDTFMGRR